MQPLSKQQLKGSSPKASGTGPTTLGRSWIVLVYLLKSPCRNISVASRMPGMIQASIFFWKFISLYTYICTSVQSQLRLPTFQQIRSKGSIQQKGSLHLCTCLAHRLYNAQQLLTGSLEVEISTPIVHMRIHEAELARLQRYDLANPQRPK